MNERETTEYVKEPERGKTKRPGVYRRGGRYWITFNFNGKRYRRPAGTSEKEAGKALDRIRGRIASGDFNPSELEPKTEQAGVLFDRAVDLYIAHREAQGKRIDSYYNLETRWKPAFEGRTIASITSEEIEGLLARWSEEGLSPATRNRALAQLSGMFSYCYGRRWIDAHPTERGRVLRLPEDNARDRWLTVAEIETLIENSPEWLKPIVRFASMTAMRRGEIFSLAKANYHAGEDGKAYLVTEPTKNGTRLTWPLEGWAKEYVEARVEECRFAGDPLFPGPEGESARDAVRRDFPKAVKAAGLPYGRTRHGVTFHSLRRTGATLALNAGVPEYVVQKMGNWKDRRMLARYAKVADTTLRDGAAKLARIIGGGHTPGTTERSASADTKATRREVTSL